MFCPKMKGSVLKGSGSKAETLSPHGLQTFKIKHAKYTGFECHVWNIREHGVSLDWNITYITITYMIHLAEMNMKEQTSCGLI